MYIIHHHRFYLSIYHLMKWNELIKDNAWVVDDLLTPEECTYFLREANALNIIDKQAAGDIRHRDSTTVSLDDESLARRIFDRIETFLPQEVVVDSDCDDHLIGLNHSKNNCLYGTWKPYALNSRWRVACYPGKGHFGPHRDGCHIVDEHHRSLITINGYLTDRPSGYGGATRFVRDDLDVHQNDDGIYTTPNDAVLHRIEADKAGKAVVFFHDLMHDGEPLKDGSPPKWLFRTEVMYERDPDTAPKLSREQVMARELLEEAEAAEMDCDIPEATRCYRKAYRLDPTLDGA